MPEESRPKRSPKTRLAIIEAVLAGQKQSEVAQAFGVTKQYVSSVMIRHREDPEESAKPRKRGRRPAEILSPNEAASMQQFFLTEKPANHGFETELWRAGDARKIVIERTGKYVTIQRLRSDLREWGVPTVREYDPYLDVWDEHTPNPVAPLAPPAALTPAPSQRRRGRPPKLAPGATPALRHDTDQYSDEDLQAMEVANREILARLEAERRKKPGHPKPLGRHAKQHRTPFTPKKKKRRKR